jgi:hypothetical protein
MLKCRFARLRIESYTLEPPERDDMTQAEKHSRVVMPSREAV